MQKICYICHKPITDDSKTMKNHDGYCHLECFNDYINSLSNSKRKKQSTVKTPRAKKSDDVSAPVTKKNKTEEEYRVQKAFADYLVSVSGESKPRVEWLALAKNYAETYKFSYEDMRLALQYWFEIKGNVYNEDKNPVGMIPYVINEAKAFYSHLAEVKRENSEFDWQANQKTEVHIEKPKGKPIGLIDIGGIG